MAQDDRPRGSRGEQRGGSGPKGADLLELGPADDLESGLLEFEETSRLQASIKVIGVGGGVATRSTR